MHLLITFVTLTSELSKMTISVFHHSLAGEARVGVFIFMLPEKFGDSLLVALGTVHTFPSHS